MNIRKISSRFLHIKTVPFTIVIVNRTASIISV